ncbi:GNAT family N-acetyltransferase [Demequina subtropica]|uniref:GNAT family N-acetyltransferase n=1 Tax=Demequina subtropica TaxID=1638989 RepID=UPI000782FEE5|nr:GNAT family N-acetyltransferase [Demequina subtropica]
MDTAGLLRLYDDQLRGDVEAVGASGITRMGPLLLVSFGEGQGFVTYRDLDGADAADVRRLVAGALELFASDPVITHVEWKTRGHDHAPGLEEALVAHGFVAGEVEWIMLGDAAALAVDVPLPDGVTLRRVHDEADVRAMSAMTDLVFDGAISDSHAQMILTRLATHEGMQLWVAEAGGEIIGAGRLEPVAGTDFAGIWGGATVESWRGRGVYRALTAARAREALALGRTLIMSDSTEHSRPILERSGLRRASTTTPYEWRRDQPARGPDAS